MHAHLARFQDRTEAGQALAARLKAYADRPEVLVLGLPRGGVPVAYEIAAALHAPLDICLVRKLGVPGHKELAMGAIASDASSSASDASSPITGVTSTCGWPSSAAAEASSKWLSSRSCSQVPTAAASAGGTKDDPISD